MVGGSARFERALVMRSSEVVGERCLMHSGLRGALWELGMKGFGAYNLIREWDLAAEIESRRNST